MTNSLKSLSQLKRFQWRKNNLKKSRSFQKKYTLWKLFLETALQRRRRSEHVLSKRLRVINKKSPRSKPLKRMTNSLKPLSQLKRFQWRKNNLKKSRSFQKRFVLWKPSLRTANRKRRRYAHV
ncbi:uncharacterized protein LOC133840246 [Drosophila sulfurigaster albostrigata]|uniref:uncharacterized protein LOC133840246 n=1 Tax=Drosophila sulfurigaster albostrigata TaxID=89887 RepID=UPI002D21C514|nr:uncharacterized protein LOC133840246 [Drosophila sulfurigaster albostrigata]